MTNDSLFRESIAYLTPETAKCHSFVMLPRLLLTHKYYKEHLSPAEAMCYSLFWARTNMAAGKKWIDSEGHIYVEYPFFAIKRDMGVVSDQTIANYLLHLIDAGLIERVKRWQGLSNLYYVKDFTTIMDEQQASQKQAEQRKQENTDSEPKSLDELYKDSLKPLTQVSVRLKNFIMVPRLLFTHSYYKKMLTMNEVIVYSQFLARAQLSIKNNWITKDGSVYVIYTYNEICEDFGYSRPTASKYLKNLKAAGLLQTASAGKFRASTYFVMDYCSIEPDRSPAGDYGEFETEGRNEFIPPVQVRGQQFRPISEALTEESPFQKWNSKNETPAASPAASPDYSQYEIIRAQYEKKFDILLSPEMRIADYVYNIIDIVTDVSCNPQKVYNIDKKDIPGYLVKMKFEQNLTSSHVENVINAFQKVTTKIYNTKGYLITSLYKSIETNAFATSNTINHDFYGTS